MDSPLALHKQHQLTKIMFLFLKLSPVEILHMAIVQEKKRIRAGGTLVFQMLFHFINSA